MKRYAMTIGLRADKVAEYKALHADVWPAVLATLHRQNIRAFSIFLQEPENVLFGTYEYHGTDHAADQKAIAACPDTQRWWKLTDPCQVPRENRAEGEWWAPMEEVFRME